MEIIDYIPFGRGNAVKRQQLCKLTGLPDREMRREIERARREYAIINLQSGDGYFRPDPADPVDCDMARAWVRQETARAKSQFRMTKGARLFCNEDPGQLELAYGGME